MHFHYTHLYYERNTPMNARKPDKRNFIQTFELDKYALCADQREKLALSILLYRLNHNVCPHAVAILDPRRLQFGCAKECSHFAI
jgi:hypothetical protein